MRSLRRQRWVVAGCPERHRGLPLPAPDDKNPQARAFRRLGEMPAGRTVLLSGARGLGKTQAVVWAVRWWIERRQAEAKYSAGLDVLSALHGAFGRWTWQSVWSLWSGVAVLVIDNLHMVEQTANNARSITHLLDARYAARLTTILVTNETVETSTARLGPDVVRRIEEDGGVMLCGGWKPRGCKTPQEEKIIESRPGHG